MNKKAFVHDRIVHLGGAEKVFIDLIRVYASDLKGTGYPSRDSTPLVTAQSMRIFTLFSNRKSLPVDGYEIPLTVALPRRINQLFVRWSRPETTKLCKIRRKFLDYRNLIVIYPLLTRLLAVKIRGFNADLIVISSFAAVKNIVSPYRLSEHLSQNDKSTSENWESKTPKTILYIHSPMQYIHENYQEYLSKLSPFQLRIFKPTAKKLRARDLIPRTYDEVYANSNYTAECVKRYYNIDAKVRYPRIEKEFVLSAPTTQPHSYYLYVGRLVKFIREVDLIIQLFNKLELPLLIMWSWPDEFYLKSIAGDTVTFIGQSDTVEDKVKIMKHARGLINLTKESCGMATMEALAVGVPVFGYNQGGTAELVDEKSGLMTSSKELSTLVELFKKFEDMHFDRLQIKQRFLEKVQNSNTVSDTL